MECGSIELNACRFPFQLNGSDGRLVPASECVCNVYVGSTSFELRYALSKYVLRLR